MELARPFCCSVAGRVGRDCDGDEVRRLTVSLDVISEVLPLLRKTSSKVEDFVVSGCGCVVGAWEKCTATYEGRCTGLRSLVLGLRRHGGEVESCAVEEYPVSDIDAMGLLLVVFSLGFVVCGDVDDRGFSNL